MTWELSGDVSLRNDRVPDADADRQMRTASEILQRLADQPGLVLADEVGMGKTYVALAVAVSVLEVTRRRRPVVVMVPAAVAEKWPTEWAVFADRCLPPGHGLRASDPVRSGSGFLKLLDDPASSRTHLIFLTHGALAGSLQDPFIRLALVRQATKRRRNLLSRRPAIARAAKSLVNDSRFGSPGMVEELLGTPEADWRSVWEQWRPHQPLDDDPVPYALLKALEHVDLDPVREALLDVPVNHTATYRSRLKGARRQLNETLKQVWAESLGALDVHLPLLVLDEAHHVKNPTRLARLFANEEAEQDAEALQGPLGNMFEKMLFLTATPFQLGHHELLQVLGRFHGVRWPSALARTSFDQQIGSLGKGLDRAQATALRFERAWSRIDPLDASAVAALPPFEPRDTQPETLRTALAIGEEALADIDAAEALLRPWVIRHVKPHKADRRRYRPGRSILDDSDTDTNVGLVVGESATLPFLLAARAQAVASLDGSEGERSTRAYFAYGLASSFEAYADTRRNRSDALDELDDEESSPTALSPQLRWYLDRIAAALPPDTAEGWASHPKVAAMRLLSAGDWHGDEDCAAEVIARAAETGCGWVVQVGDFGFGFFRLGDDPAEPGDWAPRCPFARHVSTLAAGAGVRVVFIDGNHDNQVLLGRLAERRGPDGEEGFVPVEDHLWWAPRGHRWTWDGVRFGALGGAYSIDRRWRTKGLDYWKEETTTATDVARLGPGPLDVLVCHDGPVLPAGFDPLPRLSHRKIDEASRAQVAAAVAATTPALVIHGHWHHRYTAEFPVGAGVARVEGLASNLQGDDRALLEVDTATIA